MKTYVTFGYDHWHEINGKVFDKDCVAIVHGGRDKVFEIFGDQWGFEYEEKYWCDDDMRFFPRGYIEIEKNGKEKSEA